MFTFEQTIELIWNIFWAMFLYQIVGGIITRLLGNSIELIRKSIKMEKEFLNGKSLEVGRKESRIRTIGFRSDND